MSGESQAPRLTVPDQVLVTARQAAQLCSVSLATWHRMVSAGRVPAPMRLSPGCVRWRADELRGWAQAGCPCRSEWEARLAAQRDRRFG